MGLSALGLIVIWLAVGVNVKATPADRPWLGEFAVESVLSDPLKLEARVHHLGLSVFRKLEFLGNVYHLKYQRPCTRISCRHIGLRIISQLIANPEILHAEQLYTLDLNPKRGNPASSKNTLLTRNMTNYEPENEILAKLLRRKYAHLDKHYKELLQKREKDVASLHFNDPLWPNQWQLHNTGQFGKHFAGIDLNVMNAYKRDYRGQGVVVAVLDDGIDVLHRDLRTNFDPVASINLNEPWADPDKPRTNNKTVNLDQAHGTMASGEIAAEANNSFCGVGVAHKASIGGVRFLDGPANDLMEAFAVTFQPHYVDIYSNSWGPSDDGDNMERPTKYMERALRLGVKKGRQGLGSIYVLAGGNGGMNNDNCGADSFVNNPYIISVSSVNVAGENVRYGEKCAALTITAPVGGYHSYATELDPQIATTSANQECTEKFVGTSAATPLVAACVALALQANPNLSWRDMQHVIVRSGRVPNRHQEVWQRNGAGHHVSHYYGSGMLDCSQLVVQAQRWNQTVGSQHKCLIGTIDPREVGSLDLRAGRKLTLKFWSNNCIGSTLNKHVDSVEHVILSLTFTHQRIGDLAVWLTSPAGTVAPLLLSRERDSNSGERRIKLMSRMSWDENPAGEWIVDITDNGLNQPDNEAGSLRGQILHAKLTVLGTSSYDTENSLINRRGLEFGPAKKLTVDELADVFHEQRDRFLTDLPIHRKVFELVKSLEDFPSRDELSDFELKQVNSILADKDVDEKDLAYLKSHMGELLKSVDTERLM